MKINELTGAALDWAVAKSNGEEPLFWTDWNKGAGACYSPSGFWAQGGPIIEREGIALIPGWTGERPGYSADGDTPLIAAMRCYIASKLGESVEVPQELI